MSDFQLPELPSDEELGISEEDARALQGESPETTSRASADGDRRDRTRRSSSHRRGLLTLLLLSAFGWTASIRTGLPEPASGAAPDTAFSATRAALDLREISRAPRPTGSPEHTRVRAYLVERLSDLGLDPEIQTTTSWIDGGATGRSATVRNIVARVPGEASTGTVVVTAHYDGVPLSPAAGDDGSGLVTILEAVRALLARDRLQNDLVVLFTDAEELGLMGADAFVREHPAFSDVGAVVSFEMRGSGGPSILFETAEGNSSVLRALRDRSRWIFGTSVGEEFFRYMPNRTDFTVFERAGIQGLNFAAIDNAAVYHTPRDLPSELSLSTLQHHGEHALASLIALGEGDLGGIRTGDGSDLVYFTVPFIGLITYPASWVGPLAGLLVLLAVAVYVLAIRRGARQGAVVVGLGMSLVATSLGYGAGEFMIRAARPAHPEAGHLPAALFYSEGWYVSALAAIALFLVTTLAAIARQRISPVEWTLGALILPLISATVLAFTLPLAAMTVQWPVASTLTTVGFLALLGSRARGWTGWALSTLFAVPVILFLVPAAEFLWLAGTFRLAGWLGALMVTGFLLTLPLLSTLVEPSRLWSPAVALGVAAAALGLARLGAGVSPLTPVPTTLAYAWDRETGEALWITGPETARGEGAHAEAASWVAERTGREFDQERDLSNVGYLSGPAPVTDATPIESVPPTVVLGRDTVDGGVRRATLSIRSEIGAEQLYLTRPGGPEAARIVTVNGHPVGDPFGLQAVEHWGIPDSMVTLGLEIPVGTRIEIGISEHHLRPWELLGTGMFQRPPGLLASTLRKSDRAILTTRWVEGREATPPAAPDTLGTRGRD